jgi:hypothetical protein
MSLQPVPLLSLDFHPEQTIEIEVSPAPMTSDAGLLPIRQFDERIGATVAFAAAIDDQRDPLFVEHSVLTMVRQRIYGILADYVDQNDHDHLRSDPVFKLIVDKLPTDADLASQPTLSRFENAVTPHDLFRLRDAFVDQFIASFPTPPGHLTFDLDAFDDPAHGQQQMVMFHGHYDQYQYLPIAITCAENDEAVLIGLRYGTCHAALGADEDLRYLVGRLRAVWPDVHISVRGDCGFGVPRMYDVCEELRITYTFGIGMNPRLQRLSADLLTRATEQYEQTSQFQRLFSSFEYQAEGWPGPRSIIIKAEAGAQGTNRRAVVSNRPGCELMPGATYDEYVMRGESENRNKELKTELQADRLSDHRFLANFFRLYLHTAALNLLVRLRRAVALPLPPPSELGPPAEKPVPALPEPPSPTVKDTAADSTLPTKTSPTPKNATAELPPEALPEPDRKRFFNQRRRRDPLGEGFASTWRTRLIKVAAEVITSARRVVVRLSASWPYLEHFVAVSRAVSSPPPTADPSAV